MTQKRICFKIRIGNVRRTFLKEHLFLAGIKFSQQTFSLPINEFLNQFLPNPLYLQGYVMTTIEHLNSTNK